MSKNEPVHLTPADLQNLEFDSDVSDDVTSIIDESMITENFLSNFSTSLSKQFEQLKIEDQSVARDSVAMGTGLVASRYFQQRDLPNYSTKVFEGEMNWKLSR